MTSAIGALAELAQLFARHQDPTMLCRAIAHSEAIASPKTAIMGVQLLAIGDQGRMRELGSFGERAITTPAAELSTGDGLIAQALRRREVFTKEVEGRAVSIVPLVASYPLGCLAVAHSPAPKGLGIDSEGVSLIGALGALYLSDFDPSHTDNTPGTRTPLTASPRLSTRQTEVLRAIALGQTNQQIADATRTSLSNIRQTAVVLFRKLGVQDRRSAVEAARRFGLVD
jgi:DNA-binding CsgD family transcriptional regulator